MNDVFNRPENPFGGAFSADGAKIVFATGGGAPIVGTSGGVGLLTQSLQSGLQQQITRLYEIGTEDLFYVRGRSQGMLSMGRVLGPRPVQAEFYRNYGDVCAAANNNINFELTAGCNTADGGQLDWLMKNIVLISVSFSLAAQDMIVNEQVSATYNTLTPMG